MIEVKLKQVVGDFGPTLSWEHKHTTSCHGQRKVTTSRGNITGLQHLKIHVTRFVIGWKHDTGFNIGWNMIKALSLAENMIQHLLLVENKNYVSGSLIGWKYITGFIIGWNMLPDSPLVKNVSGTALKFSDNWIKI